MGTQRTTFEKLQRERAKKAKAAAKRERRQERGDGEEGPEQDGPGGVTVADLLTQIETLHKEFDDKAITFEEFEERKEALIAQLASLPMA